MKKVGYENDQAGVFRRGAREKLDQRPFEGEKPSFACVFINSHLLATDC